MWGGRFCVKGKDAACTGGSQPPRLQRSQGQVASHKPLTSTGRFGGLGEPQICILQQNCPGLCPRVAGTCGAARGQPRRVEAQPAPGRAQDQGDGVQPSVTHRDVEVGAGDVAGKDACIFKTNLNHLNWHVLCLSVQRNRFKISCMFKQHLIRRAKC